MAIGLELLRQLSALPDWAVLTDQQTSQVLGLSVTPYADWIEVATGRRR